MNSRERVYKALRFDHPDRVPRDLWAVPAIAMFRPAELKAVLERFPSDIVLPVDTAGTAVSAYGSFVKSPDPNQVLFRYGPSPRSSGTPFIVGTYVDEWGCPWEVGEDGVAGEVKHAPLADWKRLDSYKLPWEVLEGANWGDVDRVCAATDKFVLSPWHMDLFERMQFLRGSEALYMDLAWGVPEVFRLRDMVYDFFAKEVELWCKTDVDAIRIFDDWGAQRGLLISPQMWRGVFKPLYADYCRMIHAAGKFVFYHSDGNITAIFSDLIEIGVDAINSQLFVMDIEDLGRRYQGKITFWGEMDRQRVLPFGKPEEVRAAVRRVRRALDAGHGGVIAQLEWGKLDPLENVETAFETWME
jgi:uroporphyrinogen decarboxylase